ncbi:MAG: hypothetical protein ACREFV_04415 [Acetobacteraceae bacterium]
MTTTVLPLISPLQAVRARGLLAGSGGFLAGASQDRFTVPESAFVEAPGVPPASVIKEWKDAAGFSAMAIGALLQPMFDSVHLATGRFGGGTGEASWKPMLVAAIGEGIAGRGGLGLTDTVFRELLRQREATGNSGAADPSSPAAQQPDHGGQM